MIGGFMVWPELTNTKEGKKMGTRLSMMQMVGVYASLKENLSNFSSMPMTEIAQQTSTKLGFDVTVGNVRKVLKDLGYKPTRGNKPQNGKKVMKVNVADVELVFDLCNKADIELPVSLIDAYNNRNVRKPKMKAEAK